MNCSVLDRFSMHHRHKGQESTRADPRLLHGIAPGTYASVSVFTNVLPAETVFKKTQSLETHQTVGEVLDVSITRVRE